MFSRFPRRELAAAAALLLLLTASSHALAQAQATPLPNLADYHHTRWTAGDGAPPAIRSMAQTTDGWLWLGTLDGLYRFDGVRFARYPLPPGLGLNRNMIPYLHAGPHGELYIGRAAEGITVLHPDGRVQDLPQGPAQGKIVEMLLVDTDDSVWIVSDGIHRLHAGHWRTIEAGSPWNLLDLRGFTLDAQGRMWISRETSTWRLDRRQGRFVQVLDRGGDLLHAPDGALWLMSDDGDMRPLSGAGSGARRPGPLSAQAQPTGQFAPDGALWALDCGAGPCVLPDAARRADAFRLGLQAAAGAAGAPSLSGNSPNLLLADREGAVWTSSESGINRFRRKRVLPTALVGNGANYSIAADADGRVWAAHAATGRLWELRPEGAQPQRPRHPVTVVARDPDGALLLGGRRSISRQRGGAIEEVALPPGPGGQPMDMRMVGVLDDGELLWTATYETGLIAWRDGVWRPASAFRLPAKIYQSALAGPGQLWLATGDGELFHYDAAPNATGAAVDIRALGMTAAIFPGTELLLSGDNGAGIMRGGALSMLRAADPNVLRNVSGMVVTPDGDRWLNGAAGLVHITAADWKRSADRPSLPLRYEVFDSLDGYPGRAVFESRWLSAASGDGKSLWLVATGGVVRVDTARLERNRIAPTPVILSLSTETATVAPGAPGSGPIRLAPGTGRFRIDFTAPSLRMPERVRFEYMLEGVDAAWQDAGGRRSTSYTSVAPGQYLFRLRAINEDGVPSRTDATLALRIAPTFLQTIWFKLLATGMLVFVLGLAYRLRVRYLTRRVAEKMRVRMAERERIARTLHDTFLQTVQSLVLRVDAIAAGLPKETRERRELEAVLRHAGSALGEGREQLQELRSESRRLDDLLEEIVAGLQAAHPGIVLGLRVEGARRRVDHDAAAEVAAIAREALHNACIHAGAGQVRAVLDYGREGLRLSVADDGRGIDAEVLRKGRPQGHWGLVGMRERAQRIGATLAIGDGAEGGTLLVLTVPAPRAYGG